MACIMVQHQARLHSRMHRSLRKAFGAVLEKAPSRGVIRGVILSCQGVPMSLRPTYIFIFSIVHIPSYSFIFIPSSSFTFLHVPSFLPSFLPKNSHIGFRPLDLTSSTRRLAIHTAR